MKWKIAEAKKRFSEMIHRVKNEPQFIYNRDTVVAVVLEPKEYREFENYRVKKEQGSLADAFTAIRTHCAEEFWELPIPERKNRHTAWRR